MFPIFNKNIDLTMNLKEFFTIFKSRFDCISEEQKLSVGIHEKYANFMILFSGSSVNPNKKISA